MSQSTTAYEAVIGLEVHVQLKTRSKLFTAAPYQYGAEPNTLIDPVVLALPGTLPVLNKAAIEQCIRLGLMLNCEIAEVCKWDRKNYFYPDSPKNYQISQYDQPLCIGGQVEIELPGPARNIEGAHRIIELTRIHLEEDPAKLTHEAFDSLINFNRAGVPLAEIVTEPVLRSSDEAVAFLNALRMLITAAGISDCDMEKGQLRCDANVSLRPVGSEKLGTRTEMKNLNSVSATRAAIEYEIQRQQGILEDGGSIDQETRRWDPVEGRSYSLRGKEDAHDYRYFPDPDLMPVRFPRDAVEALRAELPERPFDRQRRYQKDFDLPYTLTSVLCPNRPLAEYFEAAVALCSNSPQAIANWIANDLLRELSENAASGEGSLPLEMSPIRPEHIAGLVRLVEAGTISKQIGKEVFGEMFRSCEMPEAIVERKGLKQSNDSEAIETLCREVIAAKPDVVADFKSGNEKAINSFKGPIMKASKGKANPQVVDAILRKLLSD